MSKIGQLKKHLVKVNKAIIQGHTYFNGKPINSVKNSIEFEIATREKYGNKNREAFLK